MHAVRLGVSTLFLLFLSGAAPAAAQGVSDTDFSNADWTHSILYSIANPTATLDFANQVLSGGNPGAFQHAQHTTDGGGSLIYDGHLFIGGGAYDPSTQGAIESLEVTYDIKHFNANGVASGLLVVQGGVKYILGVDSTTRTDWTSVSRSATDSDLGTFGWKKIDGTGVLVNFAPDFSASGGSMQFGYYTFNWSNVVGFFVQRDWGIDNFAVNLTGSSIPTLSPAGLLVFAAGLLGFIGYYRRRF